MSKFKKMATPALVAKLTKRKDSYEQDVRQEIVDILIDRGIDLKKNGVDLSEYTVPAELIASTAPSRTKKPKATKISTRSSSKSPTTKKTTLIRSTTEDVAGCLSVGTEVEFEASKKSKFPGKKLVGIIKRIHEHSNGNHYYVIAVPSTGGHLFRKRISACNAV